MTQPGETAPAARSERVSELSAAILRISASLDVKTVLQEAVDSASALTDARYGFVVTVDGSGTAVEVVSSGFTDEEHRQLTGWTDGPKLFERLRDLPGPIRLSDLPEFVRALGFSPELMRSNTFQGMPMRHGENYIGHFFLAEKHGEAEFTAGDEEVMVLFAAQAATAIANARAHRDERRARTHLEALVETSPVGVVVMDAGTGAPASINREARRIVEGLRDPGRPAEELLGVVRCRFRSGREVGLDEVSLAKTIGNARTLRAEEVVLSVPDGRSLTTLVNVTPIRARDGDEAVSVVVTLQDLAPLQELERQRAEFLGMVSHELRTPLAAVRGSAATLLEDLPGLDPAETREFCRIIHEQAGNMRALIGDLLDAGQIETGTLSVSPEPSEAAQLVELARNTFIGGGGRHTVLVDLPQVLPRVMADRRRIVQVLTNLLSNAAAQSPEGAPIRVAAEPDGVHLAFSVSDEGRGIAQDRLPLLFRKYSDASGSPSGAGLGLRICRGLVEAHGGRIRAESRGPGRGNRFTFTVPVAGEGPHEGTARARARPPVVLRQAQAPARVLVVDDDPAMLRYVRDALTSAGYEASVTGDPEDLSGTIAAERPDLVLLDLVLPDTDGIELLASVPELARLPVVFISAYGRDETVARALAAGADDYLVKPFSPTELTARVGAALRRTGRSEPMSFGALAIDPDGRRVTVGGQRIDLTATEYELLYTLARAADRVVTYEDLLLEIWPKRESSNVALVRNFVKQIRAKLGEDASNPEWILNVRGVGYRMPRADDTRRLG